MADTTKTTIQVAPAGDMTIHGAAQHLLDAMALEPNLTPEVREAAVRLRQAVNGPSWERMAESLDLGDKVLLEAAMAAVAAQDRLQHCDMWSDDQPAAGRAVDDALDDLAEAVERYGDRYLAQARRVAAGLAAAAGHGEVTRPIEEIARLSLTPETVLLFPAPDHLSMARMDSYRKSVNQLAQRIEETAGFRPVLMVLRESEMDRLQALDFRGARDAYEDRLVTVSHSWTPDLHPARVLEGVFTVRVRRYLVAGRGGWAVQEHEPPEGWEGDLPQAVVHRAIRIASEGYGQRVE